MAKLGHRSLRLLALGDGIREPLFGRRKLPDEPACPLRAGLPGLRKRSRQCPEFGLQRFHLGLEAVALDTLPPAVLRMTRQVVVQKTRDGTRMGFGCHGRLASQYFAVKPFEIVEQSLEVGLAAGALADENRVGTIISLDRLDARVDCHGLGQTPQPEVPDAEPVKIPRRDQSPK